MGNVALLLVGKKGYDVLKALAMTSTFNVITDVVSSRDAGVDNDFYQEISELCVQCQIRFHDRMGKTFSAIGYDGHLLAIGWRWLLPPGDNVLIIHDSILPKYRGFAPLVSCLINGDEEIGATAIFAAEDYDKGKIVAQSIRSINYPIRISDAINLMSDIYIDIAKKLLEMIKIGHQMNGVNQDESKATYSIWRDNDDYWIDWGWSADKIERFINAVGSPYSGARTYINEDIAIVHSARSVEDVCVNDRISAVGKVIFTKDMCPVVVCGSGLLQIIDIRTSDGKTLIPLDKFRTRFGRNSK